MEVIDMAKRDNRLDNVEKLKTMKENTKENIELAEDSLQISDMDEQQRRKVKAKNKRRKASIRAFDEEIADEIEARESGYRK